MNMNCRFHWPVWSNNAITGWDGSRGTWNAKNTSQCPAAYWWCYYLKVWPVLFWLFSVLISMPGNALWFMCWLLHYINRLFVCLLRLTSFLTSFFPYAFFLTSLLLYFLAYLSTTFRIDLFHFQARWHRRRPNLALVFCVNFMLLYILLQMCACNCCLF